MIPLFSMSKVSARWCSLILGASVILGTSGSAIAQTLSTATVERLSNRVHLIPSGRNARLARVSDILNIGDALRTSSSARAQLRFNDGSLARVGEQATFRFTPNTRNFQLSNGTVLLLIPPGRGRTTIQTPNAVTGIQGSALFVRVRCMAELSAEGHCSEPITFVGALTNNPAGAMLAINESGSQQQPIYAGEMVVIEGDDITQLLEFDLKTFYETSGLVEGLGLDNPTPPENLSEDLQGVWQEIQDALELQGDFDSNSSSEEIVENPAFIAPVVSSLATDSGEEAGLENLTLAAFPRFESSPAAVFHNLGASVATYSSFENHTVTILETLGDSTELDTNVANSRAEVMNSMVERPLASAPAPITSSVPVSASIPMTTGGPSSPEPSSVVPAPVSAPVPVVSVTPNNPAPSPAPTIVEVPAPTENPAPPAIEVPNTIETPRAPVAEVPTAPVETPVVTSVVEPPAPVVEAPNPAPVVVETPITPIETPIATPVTEADQIPTSDRNELPPEGFDWNNQRPAANDPEILQTPEQLPVDGGNTPDGTSAPNIPL